MKLFHFSVLCAAPVYLVTAVSLHAGQAQSAPQELDELAYLDAEGMVAGEAWLNPVVVTATQTQRSAEESLSSISAIDQDSIRRQEPREFGELLRARPGIDVISNGAFGKATSLFIRGTSSDQSLLLVDGIRMGSATTGGASWQFLPTTMIDRVEVVRGPRSSVYGADAIGGVVQVFTPQGSDETEQWFNLGTGSFGSHEYGLGAQGGGETTRFSVGASHSHTDGIALQEGGERRGYYNTSAMARVTQELGAMANLGFTGLRSQGRTEFLDGKTDFVHQAAGTSLEMAPNPFWDVELSLSESRDEADNYDDGADEPTRFDTRRQMVAWQNRIHTGNHEWVLGVDYRDDKIESTTDYAEDSRDNIAVFAQALLDFNPVSLEVGLRHDDNESYGTATTGSFGVGYRLNDHHRLRMTWGEGFKAPSFNDLYFPGFGNPELGPEESESVEIGISGHYERWFWDGVAYRTRVDNLIESVLVDGVFLPENVAEARMEGLEISAGLDLDDWVIYGSWSYLDPENRESGNRLRRRAKQSFRLEVDREIGDWSLGGTVVAQGHRFNDAEGEERLAGFGLLNLRVGWTLSENWRTRLTVNNALDKDYVTARDSFNDFDYQQPGRNVFLSLRYGDR
ncbi:vitamin B12 transporter [Natronospira proteinivora]|uniref:Vitamin B12 transporter n=1 Tax=Natronospira proteinivora TaxID=1807133 RepID=A0ABT1G6W9_9GAMM|nr:TonB-dependent receptor [Natronospira proteinivora]MCP1726837.1 vitamin B12 transporter [Natronospira proteinivora]